MNRNYAFTCMPFYLRVVENRKKLYYVDTKLKLIDLNVFALGILS